MTIFGTFNVILTPTVGSKALTKIWNFASVQFDPPGAAPDQNEWIEEPLQDVGVNNQRFRIINQQFTPFTLNTVADASTYAAGVIIAQGYRLTRGAIGNLSVTLSGTATRWRNVKVLSVVPSVRRGQLVGDGASATSLCVIYAAWQMVLTDGTKPGIAS